MWEHKYRVGVPYRMPSGRLAAFVEQNQRGTELEFQYLDGRDAVRFTREAARDCVRPAGKNARVV